MVTAELAVSLAAAVAIALIAVFGCSIFVQQIALQEHASQLARAQARGDAAAAEQVRQRMTPASSVTERDGRFLVVTTRRMSDSWGMLPAIELTATARSLLEDPDAGTR